MKKILHSETMFTGIGLLMGGLLFKFIFEIINPKTKKDVKNNH